MTLERVYERLGAASMPGEDITGRQSSSHQIIPPCKSEGSLVGPAFAIVLGSRHNPSDCWVGDSRGYWDRELEVCSYEEDLATVAMAPSPYPETYKIASSVTVSVSPSVK